MATRKVQYPSNVCESGALISFPGLTMLQPNNVYFIAFNPINSIPSGYIILNPPYYFIKPINEEAAGVTVSTYGKFLTNSNLDNSTSNIIEMSIYDANNKEIFTVNDVPIYRERRHIKCGNLCEPSGIPVYSGQVAARIPSTTPTNSPTATPTRSSTPTPSVTATPTQTPTTSSTETPTPTPTPTNTPTPTETPTETPTNTPTPTETPTNTPTPTETPTETPTNTPTPTETPTNTPTPTETPTETPTNTPTPTETPTETPTPTPTATPDFVNGGGDF
jgi:hypothetical protein